MKPLNQLKTQHSGGHGLDRAEAEPVLVGRRKFSHHVPATHMVSSCSNFVVANNTDLEVPLGGISIAICTARGFPLEDIPNTIWTATLVLTLATNHLPTCLVFHHHSPP